MKTCLLGVLAGLTICSIWPTFAQQEDLPIARQRNLLGDPNALGEFGALSIKMDEALNNNDAGALAALFTDDAILVAWDGMFFGRQAIEKRYAEMFQRLPIATFAGQRSALNAIDNAVWAVGEWWSTVQSQAGPEFERGYWSAIYVREGDVWKIRQFTISDAPHLSVSVRDSIRASCSWCASWKSSANTSSQEEVLAEFRSTYRRTSPGTALPLFRSGSWFFF